MINENFLIQKLKPFGPEKIILFGSFAKGKADSESDIDVLIIKQTNKKPSERIAEVLRLVWGHIPNIEPQVFTPEEFSKAIAENRFFITQEVLKYGRTIYEKKQ
ncbi:nucleotidyltransferase domain-containing protein [Candidatus Microgenomates bacterium]|nr:nucleotidyltransferase domain-containing protein [Candidatus Microgenomates bacterium]